MRLSSSTEKMISPRLKSYASVCLKTADGYTKTPNRDVIVTDEHIGIEHSENRKNAHQLMFASSNSLEGIQ
ncbi:uncharacterized protein MONOS_17239 [Monocercomonoides exilis]|uniref:uncharacterized protein n=1 Tax=Monocercomonoides exilis TaxID=2049356 RepID=UPI003559F021|nr:hypothetical protein MONOS_17239 [Monocercomonoides exilis]